MFEYSQRAFETQYSIIKDILINGKIPNVYPNAYILGGQRSRTYSPVRCRCNCSDIYQSVRCS